MSVLAATKLLKMFLQTAKTAVDSVYAPKCDGIVDNKQNVCHGGNTASKFECKRPNGCRN